MIAGPWKAFVGWPGSLKGPRLELGNHEKESFQASGGKNKQNEVISTHT